MNVTPLFPTPVYQVDLQEELDIDQYNSMLTTVLSPDFKFEANIGNSLSTDHKFLDQYKDTVFYNILVNHVKKYFHNVLLADNNIDIFITESWVNVAKPNDWHHPHYHPNSIVSGVYYFSNDPQSSPIVFFSPRKPTIEFQKSNLNILTANTWSMPTPACTLYLFPSYLEHTVPKNMSSKNRVSLSFNTFIKGPINSAPLSSLEL
jgi:uncharacterized protein (TIGR02466 family)